MSREMLHGLIDMIPEADTETIYNVLLKFIPSDVPDNDELKAIAHANESIQSEGTVPMDSLDWRALNDTSTKKTAPVLFSPERDSVE